MATSGQTVCSIDVATHAVTAYDGQHLFQIAEDRIQSTMPRRLTREMLPL